MHISLVMFWSNVHRIIANITRLSGVLLLYFERVLRQKSSVQFKIKIRTIEIKNVF